MIAGSRRQPDGSEQGEHTGASDLFLKLVGEFIGVHAIITLTLHINYIDAFVYMLYLTKMWVYL